MLYNCDIFADVDFGHGPVEVRCTEIGPHTVHRVGVIIYEPSEPVQKNVFDQGNEDP